MTKTMKSKQIIDPKINVNKKVELSFETIRDVQMKMQEKIEEDMLNPPPMPHITDAINEAFALYNENPEKAKKMLIKKKGSNN